MKGMNVGIDDRLFFDRGSLNGLILSSNIFLGLLRTASAQEKENEN
jgi:hypothetical protein